MMRRRESGAIGRSPPGRNFFSPGLSLGSVFTLTNLGAFGNYGASTLCKTTNLLALGLVSAIAAAPSDDRTRPGAILTGCLIGFLVGEIIATALVAVAIHVAHYPGGLHALGQSKAPPWWSNVASLAGLWTGFAGAIFFATTAGRLTALPQQWRIKPSDSLYVLLGAACQAVALLTR